MGHGMSCVEGYLCGACARIRDLEAGLGDPLTQRDARIHQLEDHLGPRVDRLEKQVHELALLVRQIDENLQPIVKEWQQLAADIRKEMG
jgi:hypothetical protein